MVNVKFKTLQILGLLVLSFWKPKFQQDLHKISRFCILCLKVDKDKLVSKN